MSQTNFTLPENFFDGQDDSINNQLICESYGSVYPVEQDDYWYSNKEKTRGIFKVFFKGTNTARTCTFLPEDDHIKVNNVIDNSINTDVTIRNKNWFNRKFKAKCFDDVDSEVAKVRLIEQSGASWILDTARYKIDLTRNISHQ